MSNVGVNARNVFCSAFVDTPAYKSNQCVIFSSHSLVFKHKWTTRVSVAWAFSITTSTDVKSIKIKIKDQDHIEISLLNYKSLLPNIKPVNFSRIIIPTCLMWYDLHLDLLECWCWTLPCVPPPSHRGHLASVQGLGGGGEADRANCGGEGQTVLPESECQYID